MVKNPVQYGKMEGLCGWVLVTGCNIENVMPLNCTLQNGLFFMYILPQ